jgi:hypothetical protein
MTEPAHISDEQLSRYRDRSLTAVELLDLDDHISACPACRERLYVDNRTSAAVKELRSDFTEHLSYADVVLCSEGIGKPDALKHIRECSSCQADVLDLSRFRTGMADTPRRPQVAPVKPWIRYRVPLGIAAAVLVVGGSTFFVLSRPQRPAGPAQAVVAPPPQIDPALPPAERQLLQQALAAGQFQKAPVLDNLVTARGTLLSPTEPQPKIKLLQPVGTAVMSSQPVLRWTPMSDATTYVVSVFDEKFQKVAESPTLSATDWRPAEPLPVGKTLIWQVTAHTSSGTVHAPNPPEPEARFQVVAPEAAERIEKARRDFPGNSLLLAVLYTQVGALDDAEQALRLMERVASQPFRESLRKLRRLD